MSERSKRVDEIRGLSVRGLGPGLFTAWADPDDGWESNVSGEVAF